MKSLKTVVLSFLVTLFGDMLVSPDESQPQPMANAQQIEQSQHKQQN